MQIYYSNMGPAFEKVVQDAVNDVQPVADSGVAISVVKDKQLCFAAGLGYRDRASAQAVDAETSFAIGSATKAFTSMVISMLFEEGGVDLNVPVTQYLPDFKVKDATAAAQMTLEDILSHRTGLPRHDALWYLGPFTRDQLFYRLQYLTPVAGAFRNAFLYNNLMYTVAGDVVETLLGLSFEDVVQTRILDALGMATTSFSLGDLTGRLDYAKGYLKQADIPLKDFHNIGPAGEINSTVLDMTKWVQLFLNKGVGPDGSALISAANLEKMYTGLTNTGSGTQYALGWFVGQFQGKPLVFHQGDADGNSAYVSFMPDDGLGVVALTNQHCTKDLIGKWPDQVATRIYEYLLTGAVAKKLRLPPRLAHHEAIGRLRAVTAPSPAAGPPPPSTAIADFTGLFSDPGYGDISVTRSGPNLQLSYYGLSWPLQRVTDLTFYFQLHAFATDFKVPVVFHKAGSGEVAALGIPFEPTVALITFEKR